jgi:hypothetical protein
MVFYHIIETDEGLAVTETPPEVGAEEAAAARGAVLIDPGPYKTFDDAYDAMLDLQEDEEEVVEVVQQQP